MKRSGFKWVGLGLGLWGIILFCGCKKVEVGNSDSFEIVNIILNKKIFFIKICSQSHNEATNLNELASNSLESPNFPFDTMPCYSYLLMQDNFFESFKSKCLIVETGIDLKQVKYFNMVKSTYQKAEFYLGSMTEGDSTEIDLTKLDITRSGMNVMRLAEDCDMSETKYYCFSPIYFNNARDRAVVFLSNYVERNFNESTAYFFKKRGEVWHMTFSEFMGGDMK